MEKYGLPSMETTFYISEKGIETNKLFEGEFSYRRPNLHLKAEIQKMTTRMNGDLKNLPIEISVFNEMISSLFYCITKSPEWWRDANDGRGLYDINIVQAVYKKAVEFDDEWLKKVWGDKDLNSTEDKKDAIEQPKENSPV